RIAEVLGKLGNRTVIQGLLKLLEKKEDKPEEIAVHCSIANALGDLRDRSIIDDLLRLDNNSKVNLKVRKHIAATLCKLGEYSLVPTLRSLLAKPSTESDLGQE